MPNQFNLGILRGGTVAQWLALLRHSARDPGSIPGLGSLSVRSLHVLPVSAWVSFWCSSFLPQSKRRAGWVWSLHAPSVSTWVSSGCSGFLPQFKDVRVRLTGHGKLPLSVRGINRVNTWGYWDRAWVGDPMG